MFGCPSYLYYRFFHQAIAEKLTYGLPTATHLSIEIVCDQAFRSENRSSRSQRLKSLSQNKSPLKRTNHQNKAK
jgi:uncharacterized protein (UPF0332 family)